MFGFDDLLMGGLMGGMSLFGNLFGMEKQQSFSAEQAEKMMAFQERMSDTSMQRRMADLQKAGLNPILAAGGGGASAPQGAMASAGQSSLGSEVMNSAREGMMVRAQNRQVEATAQQAEETVGNLAARTGTEIEQQKLLREQQAATAAHAENLKAVTAKEVASLDASRAQGAEGRAIVNQLKSQWGQALRRGAITGRDLSSTFSPVLEALPSVAGAKIIAGAIGKTGNSARSLPEPVSWNSGGQPTHLPTFAERFGGRRDSESWADFYRRVPEAR